jgi:prophage maintenance system killer protein
LPEVRYLAIRTLLRLAEGIEGDPAVRDYSALVAAHERHQAQLMGQPVHIDPFAAAAALLHAIVRLHPLAARNDIFGWLAAYTLLGLNDVTIKAAPEEAVDLVRAAERGELDEQAIAAKLAGFSDHH